MKIFFVAVHRDMLGRVEEITRSKPISIMSAYEWFRNRKKEETDRGFRLIIKLRKGAKRAKGQQGRTS